MFRLNGLTIVNIYIIVYFWNLFLCSEGTSPKRPFHRWLAAVEALPACRELFLLVWDAESLRGSSEQLLALVAFEGGLRLLLRFVLHGLLAGPDRAPWSQANIPLHDLLHEVLPVEYVLLML